MALSWNEINIKIIDKLDIVAEYESLGVEITGKQPTAKGWMQCRAIRRKDNKPSAAINVKTGRYRDLGGNGDSMSLFDFAADYGPYADWREARKHFASVTNLSRSLPRKERDELPRDRFKWTPRTWNLLLVRRFLAAYPGITNESLILCGAKLAKYPAKSPEPQQVIVLPAYGPELIDGGVRSYVAFAADGGPIQKYQGPDKPTLPLKRMNAGPSGLVGRHGLERLESRTDDGANPDGVQVVFKVEGISDLLTLQAAIPADKRDSHIVVTNASGASETTLPGEVADVFAGCRVVIIHDADHPGQDGAKLWMSALRPVADSILSFQLPYEVKDNHGADLRDWLAEDGNDFHGLMRMVDQQLTNNSQQLTTTDQQLTPTDGKPKPDDEPFTVHQSILKRLGVFVLGEVVGTKKILAFSDRLGKTFDITSIDRYKYENALQDMGSSIEQIIDVSTDGEPDPSKIRMTQVRRALAVEGGKKKVDATNQLGMGIWELNGRLVLVGAGEAAVWNGSLKSSRIPELEGKLIDFGGASQWYDFDQMSELLELSESQEWCQSVLQEATDLFAKWDNWTLDSNAELMAALVCCTWVQSTWDWRPQVSIAGGTSTGKSMLLEKTLPALFGGLSLSCSKPSEAGIRQEVGHTTKVILIDEFEHDRNREKILELFRVSSRGGKILRGTAAQKSTSFGLHHIPWFGAIETGLRKAADKNRCIQFDLADVQRVAGRPLLRVPSDQDLRQLGIRLLIVAMRHWKVAHTLCTALSDGVHEGIDPRIVESFSVPVAMLGTILGMESDACREMLAALFAERNFNAQQESDEGSLLHTIYESVVWVGKGQQATVGELLDGFSYDTPGGTVAALEKCGIRDVQKFSDRSFGVFFNCPVISRNLLRSTEFDGKDIRQILMRVSGASESKQRMGGHSPRGVLIPTESIEDLIGKGENAAEIEGSDSGPGNGGDVF